jgi:hypothetical protein
MELENRELKYAEALNNARPTQLKSFIVPQHYTKFEMRLWLQTVAERTALSPS